MALSIEDVTYTGGNNGGTFAHFLHEHDFLKDGLSVDDYGQLAERLPHTHPNFKQWLKDDGFWEDFAYAVIKELKINLAV